MSNPVREAWMSLRYGAPIVIVSGLPRSGTSMMMKMLVAGGIRPMTDGKRTADIDNPEGYFEYERVKDLEAEKDKSYVREGRGKVLKVISFLLRFLPDDNRYKVIFLRRDLDEVVASQDKMIARLGAADSTDPEVLRESYRNDIARCRALARTRPNFELIEVWYPDAIRDPASAARAVNAFLGGRMDEAAMATTVDAKLYRNRKEEPKSSPS